MPSGCVHRSKAPGLEWSTSSASGPGRFDAKGTLNERLTIVSAGVKGEMGVAARGRLAGDEIDKSMFGLDMPKAAGVIFSQPWRAWPVKLLILCIPAVGFAA